MADRKSITLDGKSLTIDELCRVARDPQVKIRVSPRAMAAVQRASRLVEHAARGDRAVYGITTGFGEFKNRSISVADRETLQRNILLSHSAGVGDSAHADDPANYFPAEVVRAVLVLRLNTFLKGHSGVRPQMIRCIAAMINQGVIPLVPTKGSVGSSGDLCPLAHLFVVLLGREGRGRFYIVRQAADLHPPGFTTSARRASRAFKTGVVYPAESLGAVLRGALASAGVKDGLALTNGATFSAAMLALAVRDAEVAARTADISAAMTCEAVCGRTRAYDEKVHEARGMAGQIASAARLRGLLDGSQQIDGCDDVQDAYSVRCAPQVHGASLDAIAFARRVAEVEINAATDNPLFFPGHTPWDVRQMRKRGRAGWMDQSDLARRDQLAFSAGNFHGQPVALAADFLAIALAELADISERRTQLLLDHHHNRGLPANLVPHGGVNSGFMLAQYCAAGLVSENKVLAHPASVDSIPTSANSEDHVSMATIAGRKLRIVLGNVQAVLAIELMVAAQALDWRVGLQVDPNRVSATRPDGQMSAEFVKMTRGAFVERVAGRLGRGTRSAYRYVRRTLGIKPVTRDRVLEPDIRVIRAAVVDGQLVSAVEETVG